jgi:hypothetical protein
MTSGIQRLTAQSEAPLRLFVPAISQAPECMLLMSPMVPAIHRALAKHVYVIFLLECTFAYNLPSSNVLRHSQWCMKTTFCGSTLSRLG